MVRYKKTAQHSVHPTWGTHRVIPAFCVALSFSRFGGESTLPPQAANAQPLGGQLPK
jgi:hypothetical protein